MALAVLGIRPLNMVGTIFLARLLDPKDFGLVALALLVITAMQPFSGLGMAPAVVQSKLEKQQIAFPAFAVTLVTSGSLFLLVCTNAGLAATLLGDPAVEPIIRLLSVVIVLDALSLVPGALLQKDLRFAPLSRAAFSSRLVELGVSLTLASLGFGVWSLVYGRMAFSATKIVMNWIASRSWVWLKPRRWNPVDLQSLLHFGVRNAGSNLVAFLNNNWDSWLVGRYLGATSLGYYSKAFNLTTKTMEGISQQVVDAVFLPTYAAIQDDRDRLARVYVKAMNVVVLITVPLALGVVVLAQELVEVLLGAKWLPMVPVVQVFGLKSLSRPLSTATASLFHGVGHPEYNLRAGLVLTAVLVPLSVLLLRWDIAGVAASVLAAHLVGWVYNFWQATRFLPGVGRKVVSATLPGLVGGGLMMAAVQLTKQPLLRMAHGQHSLLSVGIMVALGALVYCGAAFLLQRAVVMEVAHLFLAVIRGRRRMGRRAKPGDSPELESYPGE